MIFCLTISSSLSARMNESLFDKSGQTKKHLSQLVLTSMICLIHLKKHVPSLFLFANNMYSLSISISSGKIHINSIRRFIKHLHPGFKQSSIKISFQKLDKINKRVEQCTRLKEKDINIDRKTNRLGKRLFSHHCFFNIFEKIY